jgi:hypothetical protein
MNFHPAIRGDSEAKTYLRRLYKKIAEQDNSVSAPLSRESPRSASPEAHKVTVGHVNRRV